MVGLHDYLHKLPETYTRPMCMSISNKVLILTWNASKYTLTLLFYFLLQQLIW